MKNLDTMTKRNKIWHFIVNLLAIFIGLYIVHATDNILICILCIVLTCLLCCLVMIDPAGGWGKVFAKNTPRSRRLTEISTAITGVSFSSLEFDSRIEMVKGNGKIVTHNFDIKKFDELSCVLPATINYSVSDEYKCTVRVDENLLEYLEIKEKRGKLLIGKSSKHDGFNLSVNEFVIDITAPSLDEINLAGDGDFNVLSPLKVKKMEVNLAGSGNVVFKEDAVIDNLELSIAGSGDIIIEKGSVWVLEIDIAGSGNIVLRSEVEYLDANIMGSGSITSKVNGPLKYYIVGSGNINYSGNPKLQGKTMGNGCVRQVTESAKADGAN